MKVNRVGSMVGAAPAKVAMVAVPAVVELPATRRRLITNLLVESAVTFMCSEP